MGEHSEAVGTRFDVVRQRIGLVAAPVVFLILWFLPIPSLPNAEAHRLLAVVAFTVVLWITEAVPIPAAALLAPTLCVAFGIGGARDVFKSFGDPVIFLFLGGFLLAEAMVEHGLNRRIAFRVLSIPGVGKSPQRILYAFGIITAFISMWMSNTATTAMMIPIGLSVLGTREVRPGQPGRFPTNLILVIAFAASIGGLATPVGTPPNLIGLARIENSLGVKLSFYQWMCFGLPLTVLLTVSMVWILSRGLEAVPSMDARKFQIAGPLNKGERNVLLAFVLTVSLWLIPGAIGAIQGTNAPAYVWLNQHFPESTVALMGALLLFFMPTNWRRGEFTLTWKTATRIDWGTILLFGGGLALGDLMFTTGLAKWMGEGFASAFEVQTTLGLIVVFTVAAIVLSETTSNTASAAMIVPTAIAVSQAAGVEPLQPALAACLASSLGFMLPVSTPPNAIAYSTGLIPLRAMLRHGLVLDVLGGTGIIVTTYWLVPIVT